MFGQAFGFGGVHLLVLAALAALDVVALVMVWRDPARTQAIKVVWTVVIIAIPLIAGVGWLLNWSLGKLTQKIGKRTA